MTTDIRVEDVAGAVSNFLMQNLTSGTTVELPGGVIDTGEIDDWIRIRIQAVNRPPQRRQGTEEAKLRLCIEIYAKRTNDTYRALKIENDVRNVLRHAEIRVCDFSESSEPTTAYLRVLEPQLSNDSDRFNTPIRSDVTVIKLEFPGLLQAV